MITIEKAIEVYDYYEKHGENKTLRHYNYKQDTLRRYISYYNKQILNLDRYPNIRDDLVFSNKKNGDFDWKKVCDWAIDGQKLHDKASFSQDVGEINFSFIEDPILLVNICDWHIGARGTDYELLKKYTEEIISTPGLYIAITGDMLETAIRLRGVKEVTSQILEPEMQIRFWESWLEDVKHKILWATWDNHTVQREENQVGYSLYKRIIGKEKQIIYHNGIGYTNLKIGSQTYKIVSSHKFNGRSYLNPTHGQQRHMRFESNDREIALSGDSHQVGFSWYYDGPIERLAINGGSLHTNSGYAKRYFSLFTIPEFPCVELYPDEHLFVPYKNIGTWKRVKNLTQKS